MGPQFTLIHAKSGVVKLNGGLNAATVDDFKTACFRWLGEHESLQLIVLDLSAVDFMDSAGLGVLVELLKHMSERNGDVHLACLQKQARIVFEITRAYKIFDIFDTVETALQDN